MAEKLSVIIPAYNEEKGITDVLEGIKSELKKLSRKSEIIVVDDGSGDRTTEAVKKADGVRLIKHGRNMGYGSSLKTGIKSSDGEWILITDADGTYPPKHIPDLVKKMEEGGYDMVVGARTGKHVHVPLARRPAKWMLGKMANYVAKGKVRDINSGMRIFRKELAMKYFNLFPPGFSFTSTITLAAFCNGYSVVYIPIDYMKRVGKSTMRFSNFIGFVNLMIKLALYFRPIRVFGPIGTLLILGGMLWGLYQFLLSANIAQMPVIMFLSGLQIFLLGLIADAISATRSN